jgi:hypothetical protein
MENNFAKLIRDDELDMRIVSISWASLALREMRLGLHLSDSRPRNQPLLVVLRCTNAVDYLIRPMDPNTLEGGPRIEYHEKHQLLENERLQWIPHADGPSFDPPLKLSILILDRSYVIAETFRFEEPTPTNFHL